MNSSVVIIGDGWAALGAVGFLAQTGAKISWIAGTGARLSSPLPTLEAGMDLRGAEVWRELASRFEMDLGEAQAGSYLREFRNKNFREPAWIKAQSVEDRASVLEESLWSPECRFVPLFETRFDATLFEIESHVRAALNADAYPNLKRIEEVPVTSVLIEEGKVAGVTLGSGEEIRAERVIFADRWNTLSQIQGLPKGLSFTRKREPMSVLQTVFTHESPVGVGLQEGFFGALTREAGEEMDKHVWGYFTSNGMRSVWSLALTGDEVEDNHLIGKKLRRMKSVLDKMFTGEAWLPAGKSEFMANVVNEQVRFEEAALFVDGEPVIDPAKLPNVEGLSFLTDGYGPSCAFHQLGTALDLWSEPAFQSSIHDDSRESQAQAEGMDSSSSATL